MQHVWACRAAPVHIMRHSKKYTKFCCNPTWQHSCPFCPARSVFCSLIPAAAESFSGLDCPMYPPASLIPGKKKLLLCHFLTAFILKTKSCEPSTYPTSVELGVAGNETGHRRQFHTLWVCLFVCFIKITWAFPIRQLLTGKSCSGIEILHILGLVLRALFQSVKGHKPKTSWGLCSVEPSI